MTQVRYFGFVKAEEPWTGNQFKMYAGKNAPRLGARFRPVLLWSAVTRASAPPTAQRES